MFKENENNLFRLDTRVYLNSVRKPSSDDQCVGAVVGKNPGSAIPSSFDSNTYQKIVLDKDQLLPNIKSIFRKAYLYSNKSIPKNSYVQILNLFYICDKTLPQAIEKLKSYPSPTICDTENRYFPFVWYVWGGNSRELNIHKQRYSNLNSNIHFYYDSEAGEIVTRAPGHRDLARHTQGLSHDLVVPFISSIL